MKGCWYKPSCFASGVLTITLIQAVYAADETSAIRPESGSQISGSQTIMPPQPADTATLPEVNVTATSDSDYVVPDATTATKTDTPIMETPVSVQVIPQQVLQDQQATTLDQALTNVSGVLSNSALYSGWTEQIYLRGFYTNTTFRDGFRIDDPGGWNGLDTLSNIDSIEVLKGPAAILYGRVEPGGIVNLVTKKPQDSAYYSFEQSAGSWNHYITSVDATNALNDGKTLLYRVNASYNTSQSWIQDKSDTRTFLAPSLEWKLSSDTQVLMEASYSHNPKTIDVGLVPFDTTTNQFASVPNNVNPSPINYTADTTYAGIVVSHQFNQDWNIKEQIKHNEVIGTYPYQSIINAGSLYQSGGVWMFNESAYQLGVNQTTDASILDLTGHFKTAGLEHTLLTGMDYYRFRAATLEVGSDASATVTSWVNPVPITGLAIDPANNYYSQTQTDSLGTYIQDQVKVPQNVFLLAGLRYQDVQQSGWTAFGTVAATANTLQHDSATTPRYGILWQARHWLSVYASHAENFGAKNGVDWQGNPLPPEGAKQNEVGTKTEFFGGKLISSLALYDLTKTHVAVPDIVHDPTGTLGYMTTVGEINSRGVEFDMQGEIRPRWNAIVSYTFDRVIVTEATPGAYYPQGNRMPNDPEHMLRLWSTYALKGEPVNGWKMGGGVTWRGASMDATNTYISPSYAVWDAMASYETRFGKQKTTLQLNINNLFNKSYYTGAAAYPAYGSYAYLQWGDPLSAMLTLKLEW